MAISAGHSATLKGNSSNASYVTIDGVESHTFSLVREFIETTMLGDTAKDGILGLKDCTPSLSGTYNHADTQTALIESQFYDQDGEYWIEYLPDASSGFKIQTRIVSIDIDSATGGASKWSVKFQAIAAYVVVTP